jgi:DNA-binding NtrC family response regulator
MPEIIGAGAVTCETLSKKLKTPNATVWVTGFKNHTRQVICKRLNETNGTCKISKDPCHIENRARREPKEELPTSTHLNDVMQHLVEQRTYSEREVTKALVLATLKKCDGNRSRTARVLGITPATLYNKIKLYKQEEGIQ